MRVQRSRAAAAAKPHPTHRSRPGTRAAPARAAVSNGARGMRRLAAALRLLGSNAPSRAAVGLRQLALTLKTLA